MDAEHQRVAVTRKVPLDYVADNWAGAFIVVQLLSFRERAALKDRQAEIAGMTDAEATEYMLEIAKQQFVSGMIPVFNDANESELQPMLEQSIEVNEEVIKAAYLAAMGVALDPKVSSTVTESPSTQPDLSEPSTYESSTKTTSSTESSPPISA